MGNRRPVEWRGPTWSDYQQSVLGAVTRHTILNAANLSEYTRPTIVRLRGDLHFKLNAAQALTSSNVTGFVAGIAVVHEDVTAQDPADMDEDWMWVGSGLLVRAFHTTSGGATDHVTDVSGVADRLVDVRGMRKVPSDHHMIALFVHSYSLDGTPSSLQHFGHVRALIKE